MHGYIVCYTGLHLLYNLDKQKGVTFESFQVERSSKTEWKTCSIRNQILD